jgi:hypothetical protein
MVNYCECMHMVNTLFITSEFVMYVSCKCVCFVYLGDEKRYEYLTNSYMVHTDDATSALIFLFECDNANGRFICSSDQISFYQLYELLHQRYPQFHITIPK